MGLEALEPFVGSWDVEMVFTERYGIPPVHARYDFSWILGGAFLLQASTADRPAPDGHALIGADGDGFVQHYFDSRGVVRRYEMSFADGVWRTWRTSQDDFDQRMTLAFADDGMTMTGEGEMTEDGAWRHDFAITCTRRPGSPPA